jgi:hypothetical protein
MKRSVERAAWRALGVVASSALFTACGGNARSDERLPPASSPRPDTGVTPEAPSPSDDSPSSPTPGVDTPGKGELAVACTTDADCASPSLASYLSGQGQPVPAPRAFASSKCVGAIVYPALPAPTVEGPACHCMDEIGNADVIGPAGLGCFVRGRTGACLLSDEFSGCDVTDPSDCDAVCADVHQRLTADAARHIDVELLGALCVESQCFHPVRKDDRCSVNDRDLDCSSTPAAMVDAFLHPPDPPVPDAVPFSFGGPFEIEGVSGTVRLYHRRRFAGTTLVEDSFDAEARFYSRPTEIDTLGGEIIDPLEGTDDCGVFRSYSYPVQATPTGPLPEGAPPFLRGQEHALMDGDTRYVLPDRGLDLGALGVLPRFGGSYAFEARGGTAGMLRIEGPVLPDALGITTLEQQSRLPREALRLSWTGQGGTEPLTIRLGIFPRLGGTIEQYTVICRAADDGEFTIPEAVIAAVPPGFVTGDFFRDDRRLLSSGSFTLLAIGSEWVTHQFSIGAGCQRPEVAAGCQSFADAFFACGEQAVPADLCPDYLAESCEACPEYYECRRQTVSCSGSEPEDASACYCP